MNTFEQAHNEHLDPDLHDAEEQGPTKYGVSLAMATLLDSELREGPRGWTKSIYKGTSCGANLSIVDWQTIRLGSIVEGTEQCAEGVQLTFPFTMKEVWDAAGDIEAQCRDIWNATHGCADCFPDSDEEKPVRLDCKTCGGHGVII